MEASEQFLVGDALFTDADICTRSSELPPAAITVSFEQLGPEGHVTLQNFRNGHIVCVCWGGGGGGGGSVYNNIDDFKYIDMKSV